MWLFTRHGFYSAVCTRKGDGTCDQPTDADRIMVRARVRSHLESLVKRFPALLGECQLLHTPSADYAYRLFVAKGTWAQVVADLAAETDYDNFKSEVARHPGRVGAGYQEALHHVWRVMYRLQNNVRRQHDGLTHP